jgi:acid phosphatase class B
MNKKVTISFDFDSTLCEEISTGWGGYMQSGIYPYIDLVKEYSALGVDVIIVTARTNTNNNLIDIEQFLEKFDLLDHIDDIIFTNHKLKGPFCKKNNVCLHYDDDIGHILSCNEYNIKTIHVK